MKLSNKKSGFTLAEVLVTLMIIGVIAAMTIPSLMQSTAQQEYKAAFKKAVSMLNQAVTLNYALDGEDGSNFTGASFFNLLTKRLNVMSSVSGQKELYTADGMWFKATDTNQHACNANADNVNAPANVCGSVIIDVNGQKGPNKFTTDTNKVFDMFTVSIYPQKALPADQTMAKALYAK